MSSTRSRANSEASCVSLLRYGCCITEGFKRYSLLGSTAESKIEIRFLGLSCLERGSERVSPVAFYEITETDDQHAMSSSERSSSLLSESEDILFEDVFLDDSKRMLPPKKRWRDKVVRHDVIFCLNPPSSSPLECMPDLDYYLFPHDAVAEAVNETPPYEVLVSFHASDPSTTATPVHPIDVKRPCTTKLDEFAAVCSNSSSLPRRRSTDPGGSYDERAWQCQIVNMRMTGVSRELFLAIKQTVSGFEAVCGRMMQLMRLHTQQVASQRAAKDYRLEAATTMEVTDSRGDRESDYEESSSYYRPSSSSTTTFAHGDLFKFDPCSGDEAKDYDQFSLESNESSTLKSSATIVSSSAPTSLCSTSMTSKGGGSSSLQGRSNSSTNGTTTTVKKCLYCGSKSTPMWRRGPQGAGTLCNACGVKWKHGKILCGSSSSSSDAFGGERPSPQSTKEQQRRGSSNNKRKKSNGALGGRKTATNSKQQQQQQQLAFDEEMESNIYAAQNLSIREDGESSNSSLSSSPPYFFFGNNRRASDSLFLPMIPSADVDAVEAAAVLTLLKRS